MNQLPSIDSQEYLPYLLLDRNLQVQKFSELLKQYTEEFQEISIGDDVRASFPELVGLEAICAEILEQKQEKFVLESIAREKDEETVLYFDICIQSIKDRLILFFDDVTELVRLRQSFMQKANEAELTLNALKRFEYCTNKIIDSMGEVLFITTASGNIERTNKAAEKLLECRRSQLINRSLSSIFEQQEFDCDEFYQYLVKNQNSIKKLEASFLNKEQNNLEIEFNCFVIPTEITDVYNCVYIGRDITLRKQAERDMMQALEREKELRQLKSRFLSMASHEFRNPLSSILVCTDMLSQNTNTLRSEEQSFYLQLIKESALNIQAILEDILVLSKAESGKQTFNPTYLDLQEFCQQIIKEMQLTYSGRTINLIAPQDCWEFYGDPKLLWHIFTNLLSNALKYSPKEKSVDLEIIPQELVTIVTVRDRGIGIPPEAQKHLFDSFYRASNVGEISGTGLGLAIVKRAIDLHKGTIEVVSEPDRGTTIQLQLLNQSPDKI
ncbi:PAS domain S-box [Hyella patelloides LEGE 07179]|uniref:histidine kinase n=1 Tax=Hyella patelloides LEGE 07179 TaxID=945734 RepID=A0A563VPE4_9CYAN|nr:ATP-binding protein [Hyella patelloides]VEP13284.1 PAS domain S-box [Hyella patelloides LEGE 07179]